LFKDKNYYYFIIIYKIMLTIIIIYSKVNNNNNNKGQRAYNGPKSETEPAGLSYVCTVAVAVDNGVVVVRLVVRTREEGQVWG
jgi:hypothetical protein